MKIPFLFLLLLPGLLHAQDDLLTLSPPPAGSEARGVIRSAHQAVLSAEQAGRITDIGHAEGEAFEQGEVLVRFDCSAYRAQLDAANAAARAATEELNHNRQLAELNSVGRYAVSLAQARLAQAQAEARVFQVQVERCQLKAPFSGQVVSRKVQPFESVTAGTPLLDIVDNKALELHILVPSRRLNQLAPGQPFTFVPDETGIPLEARISRLGARIDEGSQTLLLIGAISDAPDDLLAGMSGTARFAEQP
ncbi:efflux transporter periplasmic adaptor subunit [Zobellella denitrificans]|uniref:efflux RND transporter periplasmic adaptor subunit n=1 Tax=Zobellella denitrificans TaxID=347534 RepID=UPI000B8C0BBE|nr:efflux RND transporter periplasmic adaptor subunit [Zobellella denitrificans]OXS17068.1 efflux transporter periplasmic adaptor subunit [Zobellella denitrificans]